MNDLSGFGAPPAYTRPLVLGAALLCVLAGLFHGVLGAIDLNVRLWPAMLYLGLASFVFVYGLVLAIRFVEARDAMTDPAPRVRLYDRHEALTYLAGLTGALGSLLVSLYWLGAVKWGVWHLPPAVLTLLAAGLLFRLWRARGLAS